MKPFESVHDAAALQLAALDNIAVAVKNIEAGATINVNGHAITLRDAVAVGHKFALEAIASAGRIVKYGAPIGRATRSILAGEYVHTHNMESEYIPTYTLESGHRFVDQEEA